MKSLPLILLLLLALAVPVVAQQASKLVDTHPPVAALDVPFETQMLNAATCTPLVFSGGSTVCLPANALVDAQGRAPECAQVEIRYRELHTPLDMILSGVVMRARRDNRDARPNQADAQLESAGMFQLEAYCNGKPLRLKRGAQAQVWMRTQNPLAAPNLFAYDAQAQRWNLLPNAAVNQVATGDPTPAPNPELFGEFADAAGDNAEINRGNQDWAPADDGCGGCESEWGGELGANQDVGSMADTVLRETFYAIGIDSFGLFNVDVFLNQTELVAINASIRYDGAATPANGYHLYLVFEGVNTVMWIPDFEMNQFRMYPNKKYRIVCVHNGQVAAFDPAALPPNKVQEYRNRPFQFTFKPLPPATMQNRAALSAALRMN